MARYMMSCNEAGYLISKKLETEVSLRKRMSLRMHLITCHLCRKYEKQLIQMNLLVKDYKEQCDHEACHHLPEEKRESISHSVNEVLNS